MTTIAQPTKTKRKSADLALVEDIKSNIPSRMRAAQTELFEAYHPVFLNQMLRNVKCGKDAEDLALQALSKALTQIDKYNPKFAFSTWLQGIARNLLIDFKRKGKLEVQSIEEMQHRSTNDDDYEFEIQDDGHDALELVIREERHCELGHKLDEISEDSSQILILRFFEELSYNEISERLDMPIGTVKARLFRAKEELKLAYQDV